MGARVSFKKNTAGNVNDLCLRQDLEFRYGFAAGEVLKD